MGVLVTTLTTLIEVENESTLIMTDMKKSYMWAVEIGEKRTNHFGVLSNLQGLTPKRVVKATTIVVLDDRKVEIFYNVPDESTVMPVKSLLR